MSAPWFKFYPSDWQADPLLRACPLGARGLWMEIICLMFKSEKPGFLIIGGQKPTWSLLATLVGSDPKTTQKWAEILVRNGVVSVDEMGVFYSRKMVRDLAKQKQNQENGGKGGNPNLLNSDNPPDNPEVKPRAIATRSQISELELDTPPQTANAVRGPPQKRGSRISDGWTLSGADLIFARDRGFTDSVARLVAEKFKNYYLGAAGKSGVKSDWAATWRNWVIREAEKNPPIILPAGEKPLFTLGGVPEYEPF